MCKQWIHSYKKEWHILIAPCFSKNLVSWKMILTRHRMQTLLFCILITFTAAHIWYTASLQFCFTNQTWHGVLQQHVFMFVWISTDMMMPVEPVYCIRSFHMFICKCIQIFQRYCTMHVTWWQTRCCIDRLDQENWQRKGKRLEVRTSAARIRDNKHGDSLHRYMQQPHCLWIIDCSRLTIHQRSARWRRAYLVTLTRWTSSENTHFFGTVDFFPGNARHGY